MRKSLGLLVLGLWLAGASFALGQRLPDSDLRVGTVQEEFADIPVTVSFKKTPLRLAIKQLFHSKGSAIVSPDVDGEITGNFKNARLDRVLLAVCKQSDATYRIEGGIYEFIKRQPVEEPSAEGPGPDRSVEIEFGHLPAGRAIGAVIELISYAPISIDPAIRGTIDASRTFASPEEAISWVADQLNAEVVVTENGYTVRPKDPKQQSWEQVPVNLKEDHADIRDALRALFRQLLVNYSIAPEVQGTISCDVRGDAEPVLWRLLGAVHSYFRMESGVVMIVHEEPPAYQQTPAHLTPPPQRPMVNVPDRFHRFMTPDGMKFVNANTADVVGGLFTRLAERYSLKGGATTKITVDLSEMPLDEALREIASKTGLEIRFEGDVFVIGSAALSGRFIPPGIVRGGGPDDLQDMLKGSRRDSGWVIGNAGNL